MILTLSISVLYELNTLLLFCSDCWNSAYLVVYVLSWSFSPTSRPCMSMIAFLVDIRSMRIASFSLRNVGYG